MTINNPEMLDAMKQLAELKGIPVQTLFEALADALLAAYKKMPGAWEYSWVDIDLDTGDYKIYAQELDEDGEPIDEPFEVEPDEREFGRIAAQAAKQVMSQKVREIDRDQKYQEYAGREGDIVSGMIEQTDNRFTLLSLTNAEALLPQSEQIPSERLQKGDRVKAYIVEVKKTAKGPQIVVSRTHPGLIKGLFELEVPEVASGVVEIKACAREPGHRTKMAVWSNDPNVDPVGTCVGVQGGRVRMVTTELRGEKVDIVPFSEDSAEFVARALSPAEVREVHLDEMTGVATVVVRDKELSLAIGREGQNARLAARLSGWQVQVKSETQFAEEGQYVEQEWAEGEWIEDRETGEMLWKPADGGEAMSAEAWAKAVQTQAAEDAEGESSDGAPDGDGTVDVEEGAQAGGDESPAEVGEADAEASPA